LSPFTKKIHLIGLKHFSKKVILTACLLAYTPLLFAAPTNTQQPQKATWYRYYDSKGVANISTNVTPNHIRYGYEALDQNMQVIKRNRPYNAEAMLDKLLSVLPKHVSKHQISNLKKPIPIAELRPLKSVMH
jgi:hypothetical protein